ncbi:MAG: hypothetical protein FDW93_01850 [Bergeyella sp.]|nr:hypothetical protein [Bergeyella sp.]
MAENTKDFLLVLIQNLSKSEKRQFRLYVNRLGINTQAKFLLLFDHLDKTDTYDESKIIEQKITTKQQLSNLKAHLYRQILISLRTNPSNQSNEILIREQIDFATILYNKGLYKQSLKILEKAKQMSLSLEEKDMAYVVIEFEKIIESQYITRSISTRADDLIRDATSLRKLNVLNSKLSNISLKLYSMMLANGFAKNEKEKRRIEIFFLRHMPKELPINMGFREKLWYYKSYVWKYLLLQDFVKVYRYALHLINLFYSRENMIKIHPVWFIKSHSYLFNTLFFLRKKQKFSFWLLKFEEVLRALYPKNGNVEAVAFTTLYNARLNFIFLSGDHTNGEALIREINIQKEFHSLKLDAHHLLILRFKIASLRFINRKYGKCMEELEKIIYHKSTLIREDLYFNSRILFLMSMFDSGLDENMDEFLGETEKFYKKMVHKTEFCRLSIELFRKLYNAPPTEKRTVAKNYAAKYKKIGSETYNKRSFAYLDVISWLESVYLKRDLLEITREKFS